MNFCRFLINLLGATKAYWKQESTCELPTTENARRIKEDALIYIQDLKIASEMVLPPRVQP